MVSLLFVVGCFFVVRCVLFVVGCCFLLLFFYVSCFLCSLCLFIVVALCVAFCHSVCFWCVLLFLGCRFFVIVVCGLFLFVAFRVEFVVCCHVFDCVVVCVVVCVCLLFRVVFVVR